MFGIPILRHVEEQLETVIHMELLVTVEQRKPFHCRNKIYRDFPEALDENHILHHAGGWPSVNVRQFEAVPVQVDGVGIVGLVIEDQAVEG
jgi:hypothetical protein